MTVTTTTNSATFNTNGVTTVFPFGFRFLKNSDIRVTWTDASGVTSPLTEETDYTVSGAGNESGGSVTTSAALPAGKLSIQRILTVNQLIDLRNQGAFFAETHEAAFDYLTMLIQQNGGDIERALVHVIGSDWYDAAGKGIRNVSDPIEDMDVANKRWVSQFLATLIGGLVIGPVGAAAAVTYTAPDGQLKVVQDLSAERGSSLVGYSAAGGVARTLEAKVREIVSRSDYLTDEAFNSAATGRPSLDADGTLDAPVKRTNGQVTTLREVASQEPPAVPVVKAQIPMRPAYIDQFVDGFFARGMLTAEAINVATEQDITAAADAGQDVIGISSSANLVVGGGVTVLHSDGVYWPYLITDLTASTVTVFPALRAAVETSSKLERTWYNRAHPGKFYMRYLAQRIARNIESESTFPIGRRVAFVEYGSGTTAALGGLTVTAGATVAYYDPAPFGATDSTTSPPRFAFEKTAYVDFAANGAGHAQTGLFALREYLQNTAVFSIASDRAVKITVLDEADRVITTQTYTPQYITMNYIVHRRIKLSFFAGNATSVRFRFEQGTTSATALAVGSIEVYQGNTSQGLIVSKDTAVIVGVGDSWIAGDPAYPERESIMTQLALELPNATVINAGVGGTTIFQQLASFDATVAIHKPDYVVLNTGTNESYSPSSATFDPTAVNSFIAAYLQMLSKIQSIGARPIILGPPSLAQSDADVPDLPEWELLNRSRLYYTRLMRALSDRPNAS